MVEEKEELERLLEEHIKAEMKMENELERERKEYQETYKDVREEIKDYKNQQKEFIEWLENETKNSDICDVYVRGMKFNSAEKMIYKDILSKYKEIIGIKNE